MSLNKFIQFAAMSAAMMPLLDNVAPHNRKAQRSKATITKKQKKARAANKRAKKARAKNR